MVETLQTSESAEAQQFEGLSEEQLGAQLDSMKVGEEEPTPIAEKAQAPQDQQAARSEQRGVTARSPTGPPVGLLCVWGSVRLDAAGTDDAPHGLAGHPGGADEIDLPDTIGRGLNDRGV